MGAAADDVEVEVVEVVGLMAAVLTET